MSGADLDSGTALFVGGFVAAICLFAALLTWVVGGASEIVAGFALALAALGGFFALLGVVAALLLRQS
jgi:hypothetical protein